MTEAQFFFYGVIVPLLALFVIGEVVLQWRNPRR